MITLTKETITQILSNNLKVKNSDFLSKIIVGNASSDLIAVLVTNILTGEEIQPFYPGEYIKTKPPYNHKNKEFFEDVLMDLGLYDNPYVYGQIIESANYSDHEPYYLRMRVKLFYGDREYETTCNVIDIIKVSKESIPYFNKPLHELINEE